MARQRAVWIVEGSFEVGGRFGPWHPTVGVALNRADARKRIADWRSRNPVDRFRLRRYEAPR